MLAVFGAAVGVAYHLIVALVHLFTPVAGQLAAPAAIVACTVAVRLALLPLALLPLPGRAIGADRGAGRVRPAQARQAGRTGRARPARQLIQLPVLAVLYRVFDSPVVAGHRNALLGHRLLGVPLGAHWLADAGVLSLHGLVFAGLFALLVAAGWACWRATLRAQSPATPRAQSPATPRAQPAAGRAAVAGTARFAGWLLPFSVAAIAAFVPLAAGLYLLASTAWTAARCITAQRAAAAAAMAASRRRKPFGMMGACISPSSPASPPPTRRSPGSSRARPGASTTRPG